MLAALAVGMVNNMAQEWWSDSEVVLPAQEARQGVVIPEKPKEPEKPDYPSGYEPDPMNPGRLRAIPGGPADKPSKMLPEGSAQKLIDDVDQVDALSRALNGFNDDYAGSMFSSAESLLQGWNSEIGTPGQRNWWADFRSSDNIIRNKLFGASLTPAEQAAYDRTTITPSMDPKTIRENLQKRLGIVQKAAQRRYNRLTAAGYNPEEINAVVGEVPIFGEPAAPPAGEEAQAGPKITVTPEESIAEFGELAYDKNGNLVGRAYSQSGEGVYYNSKGEEVGIIRGVAEEKLQEAAPSFFGGIARDISEAVTGSERATATTESLPDWVEMPEMQQLFSIPAFKAALGTALGGGPQEIAQIVQSNFPGTEVFQDEKGNYILRSPSTGQRYAIKPGFQLSDVPRALSILLTGAGGRGASVAQTALREGALQTGIETTQAATGGTFNPEDIATASVIGGGGQKLAEVLPGVVQGVRNVQAGRAAPEMATQGAVELPGGLSRPSGAVAPPSTPTAPIAEVGAPIPVSEARIFEAGETFGGRGTAGAMSASEETIRAQRAAELPVPIELARFQRTRNFDEQQRARELAKNNEVGGPIRDRMSQQQEALRQNFERFIEGTGSQVWENPYEQGGVIADALSTLAKRERTKINALYKRAEQAGEMREPVSYRSLSDFIAGQTPTTREKLAPVLRTVQEQLDAADPNKTGMITLNQMEDIRKLINKVSSPGTPDASFGRDMRGIIDDATKDAGGDVYRQARAARAKYARDFDDIDLVQKIYSTKPGSTERYVALEKVVDRITGTSAPLDSVNGLLGLLDRAGPRGARAKKELQGAVMEKIRDQAYRGITRDESGGVVIQPSALNAIIVQLDKSGKLDAIFDKKTAELLRTVNDVTKDIVTAPPGSVNASGTSSAIMNAIDTVATFGTTGIPVPAAKILNEFRKSLANRSMRKEVKRLLD